MDFITVAAKVSQHDSIWVIVESNDKTTNTKRRLCQVVCSRDSETSRVPISIISDRGARHRDSLEIFSKGFVQSELKRLSSSTDGQAACVIDFKGNRDDHLPHRVCLQQCLSLQRFRWLHMKLLRVRCRSPIDGSSCKLQLIGPDLVHQATEKVKLIQERLKTARSRRNPIPMLGEKYARSPISTLPHSQAGLAMLLMSRVPPRELANVHPHFTSPCQEVHKHPSLILADRKKLLGSQEDMKKRYPYLFESADQ
ncbi:hypothetical protein H5410_025268, partial [Solanum commersonii]